MVYLKTNSMWIATIFQHYERDIDNLQIAENRPNGSEHQDTLQLDPLINCSPSGKGEEGSAPIAD